MGCMTREALGFPSFIPTSTSTSMSRRSSFSQASWRSAGSVAFKKKMSCDSSPLWMKP
eukprot:CAMPEP_0183578852 /NCGR_PEP_ID=MMETSP0371-20130417/142586_1 /TAXON_ID=268820 /ORGANISM="Peridinium aciculiferum, Strain PAER-2" /LENGTH=57 /DNA_ID=CAMNT_0025789315 /DNA_START=1 /DNA_END=174 /DNA_ORIENTATION=+